MARATSNAGMLVLALYLVIIGVTGMTGVAIPFPLTSALALVAGILILIGR